MHQQMERWSPQSKYLVKLATVGLTGSQTFTSILYIDFICPCTATTTSPFHAGYIMCPCGRKLTLLTGQTLREASREEKVFFAQLSADHKIQILAIAFQCIYIVSFHLYIAVSIASGRDVLITHPRTHRKKLHHHVLNFISLISASLFTFTPPYHKPKHFYCSRCHINTIQTTKRGVETQCNV